MSTSVITLRVLDVVEHVKREFGDESGAQIENADVIRWINSACREISAAIRPLKALSTRDSVVGQAAYSLPTEDALQIEGINYDGVPIDNMPYPEARKRIQSSDPKGAVQGFPEFWYEWAGVVTFYPVPIEVKEISIYYTKTPANVTALDDLLPLPDKHYDAIIMYVMSKAYALDEEFNESANQRQMFTNRITGAQDDERTAQNLTYAVINIVED